MIVREDIVLQRHQYLTEMEPLQDLVNGSLEDFSCNSLTEQHAQKFEKAEWSGNSGLRNNIWLNRYLMVCTDQVYLRNIE